ncbi:HNH endonuclease [Candidatus Woesearchaeota archaeon CG_4_10_14_0_8_um_filter_47_5]|nr:MAG: HNH endonuclease [Candidatus Woesearchaeota archaeon CG_4_10_14_0_8_um_filter_47_5]
MLLSQKKITMTTNTFKLTIELVPSTVWYSSVYRYCQESNDMQKWHNIKQELFEKEGSACWICGRKGRRLEAHEIWNYDDVNHLQKLEGIHHLCDLCHKIKHIGLWLHTQDGERMLKKEKLVRQDVINHFCKVNNCSQEEFVKCEEEAFKIWREKQT